MLSNRKERISYNTNGRFRIKKGIDEKRDTVKRK